MKTNNYRAGAMNRTVIPPVGRTVPSKSRSYEDSVGDAPSPALLLQAQGNRRAQAQALRDARRQSRAAARALRRQIRAAQRRRLLLESTGIVFGADDFQFTALGSPSLTDGNLLSTTASTSTSAYGGGSIQYFGSQNGPYPGRTETKIYCEYEIVSLPGLTMSVGFMGAQEGANEGKIAGTVDGGGVMIVFVFGSQTVRIEKGIAGNSVSIPNNSPGWTIGSIVGTAIDLDEGLCYFNIDGTWLNTSVGGGEPGIGSGIPVVTWSPANYNALYCGMLAANTVYDSGSAGISSVRVGRTPSFEPAGYTSILVQA